MLHLRAQVYWHTRATVDCAIGDMLKAQEVVKSIQVFDYTSKACSDRIVLRNSGTERELVERMQHSTHYSAQLTSRRQQSCCSRPCISARTPARRWHRRCQQQMTCGAQRSQEASLVLADHDLTRRIFEQVDALTANSTQAGGAGGRTSYQALLAADQAWSSIRNMQTGSAAAPAPQFVKTISNTSVKSVTPAATSSSNSSSSTTTTACMYDVVVAGGTLGVFIAAALAAKGWRVAVVERGILAGRTQEWNISRKELKELEELGLLTSSECESCIALEFNPVRVGFHGGDDVWTRDVLNLGVKPDKLIKLMRSKFESLGGKVYETVNLSGVEVFQDGVALTVMNQSSPGSGAAAAGVGGLSTGSRVQYATTITTRLLLDCMGHASPIVRQLRWGQKPDGVCLVVGGCARGFDPAANTTADIIYTNSDMQQPGAAEPGTQGRGQQHQQLQYFWEAFPAADGVIQQGHQQQQSSGSWSSDARTTYMFTYVDAQPWRPSLQQLFADYWRLMPTYQQLPGGVDQLQFLRLLFGFFPTYKESPLRPGFDRVLQIGDASGIQSPLSFGGFGALTRHIKRLSAALHDALSSDAVTASDLSLVNPYNPGLSSAWMLQRAMVGSRTQEGQGVQPDLINKMLAGNFSAMTGMGEEVLKPFLQDVIQFNPLMRTMGAQIIQDPAFVPQLMMHVGPVALADWMMHVGALGAFTALNVTAAPPLKLLAGSKALPSRVQYALRRTLDAWEFGSGADFKL